MHDNFIDSFLDYSKDFESSSAFWRWSAYATIAAILRDQCYWKVGNSRLFPNIYVLLLAQSAAHRKGRPIVESNKLLEHVGNTKIIAGRSSIQAILEEFLHNETDPHTGKMQKGGAAVFLAEELAAGIVGDESSVNILTDIYDYKSNYKINLVSKGRRKVEGIVFTMFSASNEDLLKSVYTQAAVNGGLLGRTFIVTPDEFRPRNSLMDMPDLTDKFNELVQMLELISNLKGEFVFTQEAKKEYEEWYIPFGNSLQGKSDKTGVLGRLHTGAIKLSMILAANDFSLDIQKHHIEHAIEICLKLIPNYSNFTLATGKSDIAAAGAILIEDLKEAECHTLKRKDIMRKHWMDFNVETLDALIVALESAELVTQGIDKQRNPTISFTQKMIKTLEGG